MRQKKEMRLRNVTERMSAYREGEDGFRCSTVILRGSRGATVYGCQKILLYSPEKISLQICKDVLTVCGHALYCTSFSAGTVSLEGKITQVCYGDIEEKMPSRACEKKEEA